MKKFFRTIHLYLGLAAGLVIASCCLTGALLVFEKECLHRIYSERYYVPAVGANRVPLEKLITTLKQSQPNLQVESIKIQADPTRTVEINYREAVTETAKATLAGKGKEEKKDEGKTGKAFFNPYTGRLIALTEQKHPFFKNVLEFHRWLLVKKPGKLLVGTSIVMFVFILITGLILWWPKHKKILKQRLTFKWHAGWKRWNHDLHVVIGFYASLFLLTSALTGLAWSFDWYNDAIFKITRSEKKSPEPPLSIVMAGRQPVRFDVVYAQAQAAMPAGKNYTLNYPKEADAAFTVTVMPADAAHEKATDQLYIDQYSGAVLGQLRYQDKNIGQRVRAIFYPVHVASLGGLPHKIIAFLMCLAGFTFPVTGTIMWLNRRRKKQEKQKEVLVPAAAA